MLRPSSSPFQALQTTAFGIVQKVMGFAAVWEPSSGGAPYEARVLFENPTDLQALAGVDYAPQEWKMEYKQGDFPGLFELVRARATEEVVEIDSIQYVVMDCALKYDGQTYICNIQPI